MNLIIVIAINYEIVGFITKMFLNTIKIYAFNDFNILNKKNHAIVLINVEKAFNKVKHLFFVKNETQVIRVRKELP